jgi:hypothetical protein
MLSLRDLFDFCGLTDEEVDAIAEHEHMSEISAAGFGSSLLQSKEGISEIERFMGENLGDAKSHGRRHKAKDLERVLAHFKVIHHS